jgi:hypothetical protein
MLRTLLAPLFGLGHLVPACEAGTYVPEGMKIGFVTDYFGKLTLKARAPGCGVILHINAVKSCMSIGLKSRLHSSSTCE